MKSLEARAEEWVAAYRNARHLVRARDWLVTLAPHGDEGLRLAALTHDMERHVPGGPEYDPGTMAPDEDAYLRQHAARSALIVGDWLAEQGADDAVVTDVRSLILAHEWGGEPRQDLLQAADSLSFLEVNATAVVGRWVAEGRCDRDRGIAQLTYMRDRIRYEPARETAARLYREALDRV